MTTTTPTTTKTTKQNENKRIGHVPEMMVGPRIERK
jgi:hypothetical protein